MRAKQIQDSLKVPQPDAGGGGAEPGLSASHVNALSTDHCTLYLLPQIALPPSGRRKLEALAFTPQP